MAEENNILSLRLKINYMSRAGKVVSIVGEHISHADRVHYFSDTEGRIYRKNGMRYIPGWEESYNNPEFKDDNQESLIMELSSV